MKPDRICAVIYRRVSSKKQNDEGRSLKDQDSGLVSLCRVQGWKIIGNFEDTVSGRTEKTEKRTGFAAAVEMACREKATLVVYDLDRLARSVSVGGKVMEELRKNGAQLYIKSLGVDTNTPGGEMIANIMLAVAQWGSRNIGVAVKRANDETVEERGYRTQGEKPFGWRYDVALGQLVEVPEEQAVIDRVCGLRDGDRTYCEIADILNAEGTTTPKGRTWTGRKVMLFIGRYRESVVA